MDIDSDMDEEERHQHELNMMKKHAEQSIAILQGEKIDIEDELEVVCQIVVLNIRCYSITIMYDILQWLTQHV